MASRSWTWLKAPLKEAHGVGGTRAEGTAESRAEELTDERIQRLLRNADRLAFGIRPVGFVLINRSRLIAARGVSQAGGLLIDRWVARAGGGVASPTAKDPLSRAWGVGAETRF